MRKVVIILGIFAFIVGGCGQSSTKKTEKQRNKYEQIQFVIEKSGFIELPLEFDASIEYSLKTNYLVNRESNDTLLFERGIYEIVGFLPDTTNYYAFLHYTVADRLFPTIVTMDKSWQKIDEKIISTQGCLTNPLVDVESCYDSVWIYKDLKIKSISKLVGTIEIETDTTSEVSNILNTKFLEGFIDKYGKISIKESGLID
jgi:hypothetical protein